MPTRTELLSVGFQGEELFVWGVCNPEAARETRTFLLSASGHELPNDYGKHVGTVFLEGGARVVHVFDTHHKPPAAWLESSRPAPGQPIGHRPIDAFPVLTNVRADTEVNRAARQRW